MSRDKARALGIKPKVALIATSNFGSRSTPNTRKMRRALKTLMEDHPDIEVEGEMQADVALDLSQAMRENPHLLLYSLNGIYDLATPFFGTEYDLGHMQLDPALRGNVRFSYYPSGHMVYLNPEALKSMKTDLARFYDEAAPR